MGPNEARYYDSVANSPGLDLCGNMEDYYGAMITDRVKFQPKNPENVRPAISCNAPDHLKRFRRLNVELPPDGPVDSRVVASLGRHYDILSVTPNSAAGIEACSSWKIDLISLDLAKKDLNLKRGPIAKAVANGIYFEVCLSQGLYKSRRIWMSNVSELVRITRFSHIIASTGAGDWNEFRAPVEVARIMEAFGIEKRRSFKLISENTENLLRQAALRRHSFRNCVCSLEPEGDLKGMICLRK